MRKFFQDFKASISRGNIFDMAVGVIVGGAFSKIVTSLVNDIIMPLIAWLMGGKSMSDLKLVLNGVELYLPDGSVNPQALTWNYGNFIQTIIDFIIIALCIFFMIKLAMKLHQSMDKAKESIANAKKNDSDVAEDTSVAEEVKEEAIETPVETVVSEAQPSDNERIIALLEDIKNSLNKE